MSIIFEKKFAWTFCTFSFFFQILCFGFVGDLVFSHFLLHVEGRFNRWRYDCSFPGLCVRVSMGITFFEVVLFCFVLFFVFFFSSFWGLLVLCVSLLVYLIAFPPSSFVFISFLVSLLLFFLA